MTNGDQQQPQQPAKKDKTMANITKWIGPIAFLAVAGYGVYAFVNKKWPFDGSIMIPTIASLVPTTDGTTTGGGDGTQSSVMMNTATGNGNIQQIQRQIMSNIGSGSNIDPSALKAQIQAQIAAARAQIAQRQAALLAKFPTLPKHTIMIGGTTVG